MGHLDIEKDWWIQKVRSESTIRYIKMSLQVIASIIDLKTFTTYLNLVLKVAVRKNIL